MNDNAEIHDYPPLQSQPTNRYKIAPIDGPVTLLTVFEALLKRPGSILASAKLSHYRALGAMLFLIAFVSFAIFGLTLGAFSGGPHIYTTSVKVLIGGVATGMITFPTLYVLTCLSGSGFSIREGSLQLLSSMALIGLVLVRVGQMVNGRGLNTAIVPY